MKLTSEHQSQMLQFFTATKQQTDAELADTKQKLATVLAQKDELLVAVNDLRRQMDLDKLEIQKVRSYPIEIFAAKGIVSGTGQATQ